MNFSKSEKPQYRVIAITAVLGSIAAAVMGWLASSFEMGQTLRGDSIKINQLQSDVITLGESDKRFLLREEMSEFQRQELQRWGEEHDFFVRQERRTDELINQEAHLTALVEKEKPKKVASLRNKDEVDNETEGMGTQ